MKAVSGSYGLEAAFAAIRQEANENWHFSALNHDMFTIYFPYRGRLLL
jgi:hypothetical protein